MLFTVWDCWNEGVEVLLATSSSDRALYALRRRKERAAALNPADTSDPQGNERQSWSLERLSNTDSLCFVLNFTPAVQMRVSFERAPVPPSMLTLGRQLVARWDLQWSDNGLNLHDSVSDPEHSLQCYFHRALQF